MANISQILESVPQLYPGPGGAVAVVQNGQLLGQHVWGYANVEKREPMAVDTLMPICSITKQMLCGLLTDLKQNPPSSLDGDFQKHLSDQLRQILPSDVRPDPELTIARLCNNQSGLRDYWALTTLWGAKPEEPFKLSPHGPSMIERATRSFHFPPGSEYSYANTNFHIIARIIEKIVGKPLDELLRERIFIPAGMSTASLSPDTAKQPGSCIGYEGDVHHGFVPAENRIEWSGDAGGIASLTDMIAYEKYIDSSWKDPQSWYHANAQPQVYKDGEPAHYGFGLIHRKIGDISVVGHAGALRGYRLHRLYAADQRLSVVVMLNHEGDSEEVADFIVKKVLGFPDAHPSVEEPAPAWFGSFLDEETRLLIRVNKGGKGKLEITYAGEPEAVMLVKPDRAQSMSMIATINTDVLTIERLDDHRVLRAQRLSGTVKGALQVEHFGPLTGTYECNEIGSTFHCDNRGNVLYGYFAGYLGDGIPTLLQHVGEDVWALACPRGMDAPAPGDWTVVFNRDKDGMVVSATIGCWLARRVQYIKKD